MRLKKELIVQRDPKSPVSEVFRTLRTNIQFMNTTKKLRSLLVTSTFPGEGKSWVASNLAVTFAQAGNKVILIDADMRKGRLYSIFGLAPKPGLSNYLSGIDEENEEEVDLSKYIQRTEVENLLVMTAGNVPPNPSELLVSERMNKLLRDLREVCDIVIIDGTPCELVADSIILSRTVTSTIIVTAHKETKKDSLEKIIRNIRNVGGNLAGVVINKIPVFQKKYNERYYYYGSSEPQRDAIENINKRKEKKDNTIKQNTDYRNKKMSYMDELEDEEDLEMPSFLKNKFNSKSQDNVPKSSMEKNNNILNQINSYLDKEKKDLDD